MVADRILITGADGYLGARIARRLQSVFESDWEQAKPKQEPDPAKASKHRANSPSAA